MKKPFKLVLNLRIQRLEQLTARLKAAADVKPFRGANPGKKGVAVTGSRSPSQSGQDIQTKVLASLLHDLCCRNQCYDDMEMSHGDCVGWDEIAHKLAVKMHIRVYIHPPMNQKLRAFCKGATKVFARKPYLDRNKNMVDNRSTLIALPSTMKEEWRSGTWSTVRYARKQNKRIYIILPNGALISESN